MKITKTQKQAVQCGLSHQLKTLQVLQLFKLNSGMEVIESACASLVCLPPTQIKCRATIGIGVPSRFMVA